MSGHGQMPELGEARAAFAAQRWTEAVEAFRAHDGSGRLTIEDLECLASAAQLVGRDELAADTWERIHLAHLERGELAAAARSAFWCGFGLMNAGHMARAGGWIGRGNRLLDENDLDSAERGFLAIPAALRTLEGGDPEGARKMFEDVLATGQRFGELDLIALGRLGQGRSLVVMGRVGEGLALLDEAMVSVTAGELTPIVAGRIYCAVILVCQQAFDLERAHEWTAALSRWCDAQPDIVPFRGQCLVHRSEVLQLRGDWTGAMKEAERARTRLADPPGQSATGMAFYQLGELYRLRGEFAEAEEAYRQASSYGWTPQPGLAILRFMQGDTGSAVAAVRRAMDEPTDRVTRANLLRAAAEIMIEGDDPATAEMAAAELERIATTVDAPVLHAMAADARATLALHRADAGAALNAARDAASIWARLDAPYQRARSQVIAARALLKLGDRDAAEFDAGAARQTFAALHARPDLDRLDRRIPPAGVPGHSVLTSRQLEVLTLVAAGKTNREIGEELYLSEHTVRRHLQNIFTRIDVTTRAAATAYAYEHGLV